jgi:hypothetical protein
LGGGLTTGDGIVVVWALVPSGAGSERAGVAAQKASSNAEIVKKSRKFRSLERSECSIA